jgi:hypothetical protein
MQVLKSAKNRLNMKGSMKIIPLDPISPAKAIAISGSRACPASSMKKWVKNPEKFHQLFMAVEIQLMFHNSLTNFKSKSQIANYWHLTEYLLYPRSHDLQTTLCTSYCHLVQYFFFQQRLSGDSWMSGANSLLPTISFWM